MGYGHVVPDGRLPVFSVDTEDEAKMLIVMACPSGGDGHYYARELVEEQTLENLAAFSDRLAKCWEIWQAKKVKKAEKASS